MKTIVIGLAGFLICLASPLVAGEGAVKLSMAKKGVEIDAGKAGTFVLEAPLFMLDGDRSLKPDFKTSGDKGDASYPNGAGFAFEIKGDEIRCSFKDMPKDGQGSFKFFMDIPMDFNKGGKFRLGDKEFREFPEKIETEQFIVTGDNSDFSLMDKQGRGMTLELKSNWFGLQDNRVFNTQTFSYQFLIDPKAVTGNDFKIKIKAEEFKP